MIKVGIIGGASYIAAELIRLLINHPDVTLLFVHSGNEAGKPITDIHTGLLGETNLRFTIETPLDEIDLLFCCTACGETRQFIESHAIPEELRIIDLSDDFRVGTPDNGFIYGLPEVNRKYIIRSTRVANPGNFATAIQLALLPLAKNLLLNNEIHVHAIIGSTGETHSSPHCQCTDNVTIRTPFTHPHLEEVRASLTQLQTSFSAPINFIPVQGNFPRGIFASLYLDCPVELEMLKELYNSYYDDHNFTFVTDRMPDLKQVINTNKCLLYLEKHEGRLLIVSIIDSLLKGAAGQAVHNMNLLFGLHERVGLAL